MGYKERGKGGEKTKVGKGEGVRKKETRVDWFYSGLEEERLWSSGPLFRFEGKGEGKKKRKGEGRRSDWIQLSRSGLEEERLCSNGPLLCF